MHKQPAFWTAIALVVSGFVAGIVLYRSGWFTPDRRASRSRAMAVREYVRERGRA